MSIVLYYGNDDKLISYLEQFFKNRKTDAGEVNSVSHIRQEKQLEELMMAVAFDAIFVDQNILGALPNDWKSLFNKKHPRCNSKMILVGDEHDPFKIMKHLDGGWIDYIVLPADKSILIEKVTMFTIGKRSEELRQVYSLQVFHPADLAKPGYIEELSEFDCRVRTSNRHMLDELIILYSKAFGPEGASIGTVIGRCYSCEAHPQFNEQFLNRFYYVGVTPDILQNIRNSLRKTFVTTKTKG